MAAEIDVETSYQTTKTGDLLLFCSDGLTDRVNDLELLNILNSIDDDLQSGCKRLADKANEEGGQDNITVILARVV